MLAARYLTGCCLDKVANDAAKAELMRMSVAGELQQITGQIEVDKVEAASNSMFVAGWRPYIGWVCGTGLAYQFLFRPLAQMVVDIAGWHAALQALDLGTLMTLLTGMLGMAAARTVDKINGVGNGH